MIPVPVIEEGYAEECWSLYFGEVEFWEPQLFVTLLGNPSLVEEVKVNCYMVVLQALQ